MTNEEVFIQASKGLNLKFPTRISHGGSSCILEINKT